MAENRVYRHRFEVEVYSVERPEDGPGDWESVCVDAVVDVAGCIEVQTSNLEVVELIPKSDRDGGDSANPG